MTNPGSVAGAETGQLDPGAVGICLAALVRDHVGCGPEEIERAIRAAAAAGALRISLFAAHAVYAAEPFGTSLGHSGAMVAELQRATLASEAFLDDGRLELVSGWLRSAGVSVHVVEFATAWAAGDAAAIEAETRALCRVARYFGAPRVVAVCVEPSFEPARASRGLARAADVAAEHGVTICLEFTAIFGVPDLATAEQLVVAADRENLGYVIDTFHWGRQPERTDLSRLATLPSERIQFLQISGDRPADGEDLEASFGRLLPRADDRELEDLIATIAGSGASPFAASEVFNPSLLDELEVEAAASAMTETTRDAVRRGNLAAAARAARP
jgi:sugar phosphate isomerase/epimerase